MPLYPASPADFPAVVDLVNLAYRGPPPTGRLWASESGYISGERMTLAMLQDDLKTPGARLLLWRDGPAGPMLGCVWLEPEGGDAWYLGMLTVHPRAQERGMGSLILKAAEEEARRLWAKRLRMTVVNVRDGLIAWYRRKGYVPTGEILPFPYDDERFGRPQRDDLSFVVLERTLG